MFIQNKVLEQIFIYIYIIFIYIYINTFVFVDSLYEKYDTYNIVETPNVVSCPNTYDIDNDVVKMTYKVGDKNFFFCIDRINPINVSEILEELKSVEEPDDLFMFAELNGEDITQRMNQYVGSEGNHLSHNDIRVKWVLTKEECESFRTLNIIDNMGEEKSFKDCNDYLEFNSINP